MKICLTSDDLLQHVLKRVEKLSINVPRKKKGSNILKIKVDSENDSVSVLLNQKESLVEQEKKYLTCLARLNKTYKVRIIVQNAWEAVASALHFIKYAIYAIYFHHKLSTTLDKSLKTNSQN